MKILFINPETIDKESGYTADDIRFIGFPSLAPQILAALTPRFIAFQAIDEAVDPLRTEDDFKNIARGVDIVAISLNMTYKANRARKIAETFKRLGKVVVWGGVHVTSLYECHRERFESEIAPYANSVVLGEAEEIWGGMVRDVFNGTLKKYYVAERKPPSSVWPTPRYNVVNTKPYLVQHSIMSSKGCPWDCEFCNVTTFYGDVFRTYNPKKLADDIRVILSNASVNSLSKIERAMSSFFAFVDDNIAYNRTYFGELLTELINIKKDFPAFAWGGQTTLYTIDHTAKYEGKDYPIGTLLERSGCSAMFVGIESVSKESLAIANKNFNKVEKYPSQIKRFHDHGVMLNAGMIVGLDADTVRVFEDIYNFLVKNKIEISLLNILVPLPGTALYKRYVQEGRIFDHNWENYDGRHVVYYPSLMTPEQLETGYLQLWKELYSIGSITRRILLNKDQVFRAIKKLPNISKFEQIGARCYMNLRYKKISGRIIKARKNAPRERFGENVTFPEFQLIHSTST